MSNAFRLDDERSPVADERTPAPAEPALPAVSPRGLTVAGVLRLQRSAGNRSVGQLLAGTAPVAPAGGGGTVARLVSTDEESFNPETLVHDLRRAIDQSDTDVVEMKTVGTGFGARTEYILKRFVSGSKVKKALENLTVAQLGRVRELYERRRGRELEIRPLRQRRVRLSQRPHGGGERPHPRGAQGHPRGAAAAGRAEAGDARGPLRGRRDRAAGHRRRRRSRARSSSA